VVDFYRARDGIIYPRSILQYRDLEMKILFDKIQPYDLPEPIEVMEENILRPREACLIWMTILSGNTS